MLEEGIMETDFQHCVMYTYIATAVQISYPLSLPISDVDRGNKKLKVMPHSKEAIKLLAQAVANASYDFKKINFNQF